MAEERANKVRVFIEDHTGKKVYDVEIPSDVLLRELIPVLISALKLPGTTSAGHGATYHLALQDRQLAPGISLADAGVNDGQKLTLVPEMTFACFCTGTLISLPGGGHVAIEDLRPGDEVLSFDPRDGRPCVGTVSSREVATTKSCVLVNGTLRVTASHFMFADGRWRRAGALELGLKMVADDGSLREIADLQSLQLGQTSVFNLHLSNPEHTFFADGLLVHNGTSKVLPGDSFGQLPTAKVAKAFESIETPRKAAPEAVRLADEERAFLVSEIAAAVEARLLVKIVAERNATDEERKEARGAMVVRPAFGRPGAEGQYECDVFMIMPFSEQFESIYADYIKPIVESFGYVVKRADDFFSHRSIIDDIWSGIARCRFAIADCTGRNANVFYELGVAHTIGRPVILITQSIDDLPFDIQGRRAIAYEDRSRGLRLLQEQLTAAIALLAEEVPESPRTA